MSREEPVARAPVGDPVEALFPPANRRLGAEAALTDSLERARARVVRGSVTPTLDLAMFRRALAEVSFDKPWALDDLAGWVIHQLETGVVHVTHPRYLGLFNPQPTFPAQCADRIVAAFNPQLASAKTSPVAVEIEAHVIHAVAARVGLPAGAGGHFTTGGAEANFTALLCALTRAHPGFVEEGVAALPGRPAVYISADSHLAWIKMATQAGIGRSAIRIIRTDGSGAMDAGALEEAIERDLRGGFVPVMVVATAGTTNAGMIDPLEACATLAARFSLWFHVDAAWGGAVIASDRLRPLLRGIERADSVTVDAHKWFAATMGCGMALVSDPSVLSAAFRVSTTYMPSHDALVDPYMASLQWSRRFLGLRLFLSLAAAGWEGYGQHVERAVALAGLLRDGLLSHGWRVVNDSPMAVLCTVPPARLGSPGEVVGRLLRSGKAWVSVGRFEGEEVVRACVTNGETTPQDMAAVVEALQAVP